MTGNGTATEVRKLGAYLFCSPATIRAALARQGISLASPRPERRIGEILVETGAVTVEELDAAVRAQRVARLRACPLFAVLSKMELSALGAHFDEVTAVAGEQFISEGAEDRTLYVIASGQVEVFRSDQHGEELALATVGPGEAIGEMGYFAGGVRTASVRALQSTQMLRARYEDLTEYFENVPRVAHAFIEVVEQRRANTSSAMKAHARDRKLARHNLPHLKSVLDTAQPLRGEQQARRAISRLVSRTGKAIDADRITLFLRDVDSGELTSLVAQGAGETPMRLSAGHGIAGWVAEHRELANVADAREDERFNAAVDEQTGYQTHTVLAAPVRGPEDSLLGVVEALNKGLGAFTEDDEDRLVSTCKELAGLLGTYAQYQQTVAQAGRMAAALEIATLIGRQLALPRLIELIQASTARQLRADACQLLVVDRRRNELCSVANGRTLRLPIEDVPAASVAIDGNVLVINADSRDRDLLARLGPQMGLDTPTAMVAVPVLAENRQIIAILQVARAAGRAFDNEALAWLHAIAHQLGSAAAFQPGEAAQ